MSSGVDVDEEKAILSRLLGSGLSTEGIAAALQWVLTMMRKAQEERPGSGSQAYMRFEQLREHFGFSKERMMSYLRGFKARGVHIRMIQPTDEHGALGRVSYNVTDIEKAMLVAGHGQEKH